MRFMPYLRIVYPINSNNCNGVLCRVNSYIKNGWASKVVNPDIPSILSPMMPRAQGSHPLWPTFPGRLWGHHLRRSWPYRLQFAGTGTGDFKFELFLLRLPLLRESLLVSFPLLINMLKFSGRNYLQDNGLAFKLHFQNQIKLLYSLMDI